MNDMSSELMTKRVSKKRKMGQVDDTDSDISNQDANEGYCALNEGCKDIGCLLSHDSVKNQKGIFSRGSGSPHDLADANKAGTEALLGADKIQSEVQGYKLPLSTSMHGTDAQDHDTNVHFQPRISSDEILQKHWEGIQQSATDIGKRASPLRKFLRTVYDYEVLEIMASKSLIWPTVFPAMLGTGKELRMEVALKWFEQVNLVFSGAFRRYDAQGEIDDFPKLLAAVSSLGTGSVRDHVRRVTIPGLSQYNAKKYLGLVELFPHLQELVLGLRSEDQRKLAPKKQSSKLPYITVESYTTRHGFLKLKDSSITKLTLVKAPASNPKEDLDGDFDSWLLCFAKHLKKEYGSNKSTCMVYVDLDSAWEVGLKPKLVEASDE